MGSRAGLGGRTVVVAAPRGLLVSPTTSYVVRIFLEGGSVQPITFGSADRHTKYPRRLL